MRVFAKILAVFIVIAIGMGLILDVRFHEQTEAEKVAKLVVIQEEVSRYEMQIRNIESDLKERERQIPIKVSKVIDAFALNSVGDFFSVDKFVDWYEFVPTSLAYDLATIHGAEE